MYEHDIPWIKVQTEYNYVFIPIHSCWMVKMPFAIFLYTLINYGFIQSNEFSSVYSNWGYDFYKLIFIQPISTTIYNVHGVKGIVINKDTWRFSDTANLRMGWSSWKAQKIFDKSHL